jgi:hypothetical protein
VLDVVVCFVVIRFCFIPVLILDVLDHSQSSISNPSWKEVRDFYKAIIFLKHFWQIVLLHVS